MQVLKEPLGAVCSFFDSGATTTGPKGMTVLKEK
jgi:hypothetical protein